VFIPAGGSKNLGIRITRSGGANGMVSHTATIASATGGGELPSNNNTTTNNILKN